MTISVNFTLLFLAGFVIWWFFFTKPKAAIGNRFLIKVINGIYEPSILKAPAGKVLTLEFIRIDQTTCAEFVIFKDLDIRQHLPIDTKVIIKLGPLTPGTYDFHCQMNMYQGKLVII